jgi:DNA-directed RNA polymerase alpha subunit
MIELEELRIPTRALNALTRANIRTVYQLSGMEQKEIAAIPGVGMVTARLIQQELERFGL